jgi:type IV secretion system protein VirB9
MPPQPIPIRTIRDDGQPPRDYVLQWTALPDQAASSVNVAAAGDVTASEIPTTPKSRCYTIRYQYPADEKAAKVAAWKAAQDKSKRQAQEIALHQQAQVAPRNVNYVAQGDAALAPTSIFDDGYTTQIEFAGNRRIPVLLTVTPDGKESQISGFTTEDNGIIKIHEVLPLIRLRDGDTVLCIVNRAYNPTGNNPGTGTTSPDMNRDVGAHR